MNRLAQALDGLESRAAPRGAHPEAFARAVVADREDRGVSLVGEARLRASLCGDLQLGVRQRLVALDGRAGEPPRAADTQDAVGLLRDG